MSNSTIIEISDLHKSYGAFKAVNGLSFKVFKGDVFGFLGPNGAGKSTTIRMLLSLITPTSGRIKIFDKDLIANRSTILMKVGAIVEKPDMYGYLSASNNLKLLSRLSGYVATNDRINSVLLMVGLSHRAHDKVKTFSQGMKQRLGIAQALIHEPELIILDEPTNGLDPQGMVEIRNLILKLNKENGITIMLSSHLLNEVEMLANRMVIIDKGKVVVEGDVVELLSGDKMKVTIGTSDIDKANAVLIESGLGHEILKIEGHEIQLQLDQSEVSKVNALLVDNGVQVDKMVPVRSLEDYFLSLT